MSRATITTLAAAVLALGIGCGAGSPRPIDLSPDWPAKPASLDDATRSWTRSGRQIAGLEEDVELIIKVRATYRSPSWRAAYVEHMRRRGQLSATELEALDKEQRKTASEFHEFVLLVTTHDRRLNDLAKGSRSVWKVKLRDAKGSEVAPIEIKKDRRPPAEIAAELPHLERFDEIYIARFPAAHPILAADHFSLRLWSARTAVELDWKE